LRRHAAFPSEAGSIVAYSRGLLREEPMERP
jgi:hypothetical protein